MRRARIFIAQDSSVLAVTEKSLTDFDLVVATNWRQAITLIEDGTYDLFLVGVHFCESRTVELISAIRKTNKHVNIPIVVVRSLPSANAETIRSVIDGLVRVKTIKCYLELENDPGAVEKIYETVKNSISL